MIISIALTLNNEGIASESWSERVKKGMQR